MLTLTDRAGEYLQRLLAEVAAPAEVAVRLRLRAGRLMLRLDEPREDDTHVPFAGRTILLLDRRVAELLGDSRLGWQPTTSGGHLRFEAVSA